MCTLDLDLRRRNCYIVNAIIIFKSSVAANTISMRAYHRMCSVTLSHAYAGSYVFICNFKASSPGCYLDFCSPKWWGPIWFNEARKCCYQNQTQGCWFWATNALPLNYDYKQPLNIPIHYMEFDSQWLPAVSFLCLYLVSFNTSFFQLRWDASKYLVKIARWYAHTSDHSHGIRHQKQATPQDAHKR